MNKSFSRSLIVLMILGIILPGFIFSQNNQPSGPPETIEEVKNIGIKALKLLPDALGRAWKEILQAWGTIFKKVEIFFANYIQPWFKSLWVKIKNSFKTEGERRKPIIEEEFQKEKSEMKKEIKSEGPTLWEKFKELVK